MEYLFLIKGIMIGFSIAAPVGVIGVLCIKRTLTGGILAGLVTGLGAAMADLIYGLIAGFGLTTISGVLLSYQTPIRIFGGSFLCYLAYTTFHSKVMVELPTDNFKFYFKAFISTFLLTITNPMTILSFIGIFAGVGVVVEGSGITDTFALVIGVFSGSILWWVILATVVNYLRESFDEKRLILVNKGSGLILGSFGIYSLLGWLTKL